MQVTIQSIPASLQEFETLAASGRQPERICALFLCARFPDLEWEQDEDGLQYVTRKLERSRG